MKAIKVEKGSNGTVKVRFPYKPIYVAKIKTIRGSRWHPEEKYWSVPYSEGVIDKILFTFSGEKIDIDPALREGTAKGTNLENLRRELKIRKYSLKTIKAYIHYNEDLLDFSGERTNDITNGDIKDYLLHLVEQRKVSTSTLNNAINIEVLLW